MDISTKSTWYLLGAIIFVTIVVLFPYLYWQESIHISIHDNLDSNLVWIKMLIDSDMCWAKPDAIVEQIMNGIPRTSLYACYDFSLLIFYIFGIFWGYAVNKYLMAMIALIGMYFLLKKHFLPKDCPSYIPILVATLFSLLPFWSFTASVAGVPLVLWAFLNLRNKDTRIINWLAILLYGFYSSLVLTGFFLLLVLTILFLYDWIKKRQFNWSFLGGLAFLSIVYIISHWPVFYGHLFMPDYVSHRKEFNMELRSVPIFEYFKIFIQYNDLQKSSHALALQSPILLPICLIVLIWMFITRNIDKKFIYVSISIILITITVSILQVGQVNDFMNSVYENFLPINLTRIYWLTPTFWYILFALSLFYIYKTGKFGKYIVFVLIAFQLYTEIKHFDWVKFRYSEISFKSFYSSDQFNQIKTTIGKNQKDYRVISIGLHPAIAQYNGFYTLDAYLADYPLAYKHQFGEVINNELLKNKSCYNYFYNWGSRCYAFSADLYNEMHSSKYLNRNLPPVRLEYDFKKLKEMSKGCVYIFSSTQLENPESLNLIKEFKNDQDYWTIYVYEVQ